MSTKPETLATEVMSCFYENPNSVLVCPGCGVVHANVELEDNQTGTCSHCELEFVYPTVKRFNSPVALAITALFLMLGATSFPYLSMARAGLKNEASLIQVAGSFTEGWFILIGLLFVLFVMIFPTYRCLSIIYTLLPLLRGKPPYPYARQVYSFSETLAPWAMTEIFAIGAGVALIKVGKLAKIEFGFSFWVFALLVLCLAAIDLTLDKKSVWALLPEASR